MNDRYELEQIDEICGRFEAAWSIHHSLPFLIEFLQEYASPPGPDFLNLFEELSQIDMEQRWRAYARLTNATQTAAYESNLYTTHNNRWHHYLELLEDLNIPSELFRAVEETLQHCEYKCRCKFGDAPSYREYSTVIRDPRKYLKLLPTLSVSRSMTHSGEFPLTSPMQIGRQALGEPAQACVVPQSRGDKLICAPLTETRISRQQIMIEVIGGKLLRVTNTSGNRSFRVEGQKTLYAGNSQCLHFPVTLDLDTLQIELRRPLFES